MRSVRVVIADDHPVYREGLARNWEGDPRITVSGVAADGVAALTVIREERPEVAIVDLRLPEIDGMQVLEVLTAEKAPTGILVLTAFMDSATVYRAFAKGAKGFLEKSASFAEITSAVLAIGAGGTVISPYAQEVLADEIRVRQLNEERPSLTGRELEILRLASDGYSAQRIADELHVSLATVKTHLQHVYEKLGVSDRASAVAQGIRRGLLN